MASVFHGLTCPRQRPFGPGRSGRHPAGSPRRPPEAAAVLSRVPLPFGRRHPLVGHPVPPVGFRPSCDRPTRPHGLDPDGVSTFRACETRPGWAPPKPRGQRCSTRPIDGSRSPLAASASGQALPPGSPSRRSGLTITRHRQGFTCVHPSGLPLARLFPGRSGGPWACSSSFAPPAGRTCGRTSRRGPISNTDQELRIRHNRPPICAFTQHARPRVAPHRW